MAILKRYIYSTNYDILQNEWASGDISYMTPYLISGKESTIFLICSHVNIGGGLSFSTYFSRNNVIAIFTGDLGEDDVSDNIQNPSSSPESFESVQSSPASD